MFRTRVLDERERPGSLAGAWPVAATLKRANRFDDEDWTACDPLLAHAVTKDKLRLWSPDHRHSSALFGHYGEHRMSAGLTAPLFAAARYRVEHMGLPPIWEIR